MPPPNDGISAMDQEPEQSLPIIAPVNAPDYSAAYKALQDAIPAEVKVTASPYSSGSDVTPTLLQSHPREMVNSNRQPFNDSVEERRHARNTNTWASVSNTITQFRNKQEADKNAALTTSIATVMKAQQQIDNATAVLNSPTSSDQDKQMAQGVIEQNKKVIEGKLTDPKSGKAILKAFDVSMTDPESQKTPEHQAAKAAAKQVQVATKAGLTADTPAEKAIQDKVTGADAASQVQKTQQNAQQTQAAKNPSATPYADKFLGSMPQSVGSNPEYAAQLKQKEDRDKLVTQYLLPKMYDAVASQQKVAMQQNAANARAQYAGAIKLQQDSMELANNKAIAAAHDKMELSKQAMANSAAQFRTMMTVSAMLTVSMNKNLGAVGQNKAQDDAIAAVNKNYNDALSQSQKIRDAIAMTKDKDGNVRPDAQAEYDKLQTSLAIQQKAVDAAQNYRDDTMTKIYGTPTINPNNGGQDGGNTVPTSPTDAPRKLDPVEIPNDDGSAGDSEDDIIKQTLDNYNLNDDSKK